MFSGPVEVDRVVPGFGGAPEVGRLCVEEGEPSGVMVFALVRHLLADDSLGSDPEVVREPRPPLQPAHPPATLELWLLKLSSFLILARSIRS